MQSTTHQLGNYLLLHMKTLSSEKVQVITEFIVYKKFHIKTVQSDLHWN